MSTASEGLTSLLAENVMGWTVAPGRFLTGGRRWIARWRFQPLTRLEDAFRLLAQAASSYKLTFRQGEFTAEVSVNKSQGQASGKDIPATITIAVAKAIGLIVTDGELQPTGKTKP